MIFRRKNRESRADAVAEAMIAAREANAATAALEAATAAEEVIAGLYERAFTQARVQGYAMDAQTLAMCGRALATSGQAVFVDGLIAESVDVTGPASPMAWRYLVSLPAPSGTRSVRRSAADVLHFRINATSSQPWRGQSPLELTGVTRTLLRRTEGSLASETNGAVGRIMTVPAGTPEATISAVKADLAKLQGKVTLPESTAGGWGQGAAAAPQRDWQPVRLGPEPPDGMVALRRDAAMMVLAAGGVPVELVVGGEGSGAREAWRRFLHSTMQPLGNLVVAELRLKTGRRVSIDFDSMMASDLAGRARAFQGLVNGGMEVAKAAELAGLMAND